MFIFIYTCIVLNEEKDEEEEQQQHLPSFCVYIDIYAVDRIRQRIGKR